MNILPIAFNTYKEAIRDKVLYIILLFSIFMILGSLLLSTLSMGQVEKVIVDMGLASISIFGVLITLFVGTNLLSKEIDKKTIYLLLTKPLRRSSFIIGKHLGLSITLFVIVSIMTVLFYGLIYFVTSTTPAIYLQAIFLSYIELTLLVAIAILFSTIASPVMSSIYTLAVYIIGHFSHDLLNFGELSKNPTFIAVTKIIYYILPDLEKLNIKNLVAYSPNSLNTEIFTGGIVYGLIYTSVLLVISIFIFEFKEF
ncbi:MAG: ABC transporter permease [Candidatus Sericytochromatia bacterium]|nr:ABC transporter permease [Candidatus Sericytochromatia bacterium]